MHDKYQGCVWREHILLTLEQGNIKLLGLKSVVSSHMVNSHLVNFIMSIANSHFVNIDQMGID